MPAEPPSLELEQLQEAWQRTILPAVEERSIPTASVLREAHPAELAGDTLTVEFPRSASFHRQLAEEPKNATLLADALYEVTGRQLGSRSRSARAAARSAEPAPTSRSSEEEILELVKETFDAREVRRRMSMDLNKLMQQVQEMQEQMQQAQEELANETVEATAGGGMVTVIATGGGEIKRDQDRPEGDRPGRPGAARGHGPSPR